MSGPCCALCGRTVEETDLVLFPEGGPVCRACRVLALRGKDEPGPVLDGRRPEAPRYLPGEAESFLPPTLTAQAFLSFA